MMSNRSSKPFVDRVITRFKNHHVLGVVILLGIGVAALGGVVAAISAVHSFWTTVVRPSQDPRVFRFGEQTIRLEGGNGQSREQAIVIKGAATSDAGVAAEYYWLRKYYQDHRVRSRAFIGAEKEPPLFDMFQLESPYGVKRELWFDITEFFGTPLADSDQARLAEQLARDLVEKLRKDEREKQRQEKPR